MYRCVATRDYRATLEERARRLLKRLRAAVEAFWVAGIGEIYIDSSFYSEKSDPGVYDRIDPYWIDFAPVLVPHIRKWKWRMWAGHDAEFFIHPEMLAKADLAFPRFFRQDRDGWPRGVIRVVKAERS